MHIQEGATLHRHDKQGILSTLLSPVTRHWVTGIGAAICTIFLAACVTIQQPANSATAVASPVAATVVWNEDMQAGTFTSTLDGKDVTAQFNVNLSGRQAMASLAVAACPTNHTLTAGGSVWSPFSLGYGFTSSTSNFATGGAPRDGFAWCGQSAPTVIECACPASLSCKSICQGQLCSVDWYCQP